MKTAQASFIRAIFSIVIGVLLVKYREQMASWLIVLIGVLFLISGLISTIIYLTARKHTNDTVVRTSDGAEIKGYQPPFPIVGIGSMILGVILAVMPNTFVASLVYIIAVILILGVINVYINLATLSRLARIKFIFWFMPSVVLLIAGIALFKHEWIATMPLFILGWTLILFGIIECIGGIKSIAINKKVKQVNKQEPSLTIEESAEATEIIDSSGD